MAETDPVVEMARKTIAEPCTEGDSWTEAHVQGLARWIVKHAPIVEAAKAWREQYWREPAGRDSDAMVQCRINLNEAVAALLSIDIDVQAQRSARAAGKKGRGK